MINILGLALYGSLAASHRVRLAQYQEGLLAFGINLQIQSLLDDAYIESKFHGKSFPVGNIITSGVDRLKVVSNEKKYDALILYGELFPLMPYWIEHKFLSLPYIYDFDDAFYLRYRQGYAGLLKPLLGNKFDDLISGAASVTAGSKYLATYADKLNANTFFFPSVVDTSRYLKVNKPANDLFTVGWIGSPTTAIYLKQLIHPLEVLGSKQPLRLVVVGGHAPKIKNVEVVEIPWDTSNEVELINTFDVGVMPLVDDDWARGKCAYKLIQYMACGLPVVASAVGANFEVVTSTCGYLAKNDYDWVEALSQLRDDVSLRLKMGVAGRERVEKQYSLSKNVPLLAELINKVVKNNLHLK